MRNYPETWTLGFNVPIYRSPRGAESIVVTIYVHFFFKKKTHWEFAVILVGFNVYTTTSDELWSGLQYGTLPFSTQAPDFQCVVTRKFEYFHWLSLFVYTNMPTTLIGKLNYKNFGSQVPPAFHSVNAMETETHRNSQDSRFLHCYLLIWPRW